MSIGLTKSPSKSHRTRVGRTPRLLAVTALAAMGIGLLGACNSSSTSGSTASDGASSQSYGELSIQLSYKKNQQSAGLYVADSKGYFTDAGFSSTNLIAGGNGTSAEASTETGQALIGISGPLTTAPAINEGGAVKIIATLFQKNPFAVISAADKPINTPQDLVGKTIAVQDYNTLVWQAFLKANNIDASQVTTVPFSDTSQLTTGQVDGFVGFTTTGAAALNAAGFNATEFLLEDNGLPMIGESLVASDDAIQNKHDELVAALTAIVKGWKEAVADPQESVDLTVNDYGKDQNYDAAAIKLSVDRQNTLISTDETTANGLLTISADKQQQTIDSLALAGIDITADQLFDTSLLDDVFSENPDLK